MKIHFSKKEYRLLMDMLYVAEWVMHSHDAGEEKSYPEHDVLRKKILSYYEEMGAEELITYLSSEEEYYESLEYEEWLMENFISPYDEQVFWQELSTRLAVRDLVNEWGVEQYENAEWEARMQALFELSAEYETELEEHGLDRLKVMANEPSH